MIIEEADGTLRRNSYCYDRKLKNECHKPSIQCPDCGGYMNIYRVFKDGDENMHYDDDMLDEVLDIVADIFDDERLMCLFDDAKLIIESAFDDSCVIIAMQFANGYVVCDSAMVSEFLSLRTNVTNCVYRILLKVFAYYDFDTYNNTGDDCENCEYFHECCGDDEFI